MRAALRSACLAALATAALAARAEPVVYRLDPTHSFVHFEVLHFGTSTLRGRFGPIDGEVTLDREARAGHVGLTIDTVHVSTGTGLLDERLREKDLLATAEYPLAYFVSDRFLYGPDGKLREVRGEFTIRGVSQPLSLVAHRFDCYTSPLVRREVCGGDFEAQFDRSSIGATYGLPFVSDRVKLIIEVEAVRQ